MGMLNFVAPEYCDELSTGALQVVNLRFLHLEINDSDTDLRLFDVQT
jgi:hypothetical protein